MNRKQMVAKKSGSKYCGFHCIKIKNFSVTIGDTKTADDYDTEQLSLFDEADCAECPGTCRCSDCDRPTEN